MKRKLFFLLLVTGLILLALGGWTVQGLRWATDRRLVARPPPARLSTELGPSVVSLVNDSW